MRTIPRRWFIIPGSKLKLLRGPSHTGRVLHTLENLAVPICTCSAGLSKIVHGNGCDPKYLFTRRETPVAKPPASKELILPFRVKPRRKPRRRAKKGQVREWGNSYKLMLSFSFTRPVNIALWKKIKAPPGWRKNPTTEENQRRFMAVRFQCTDIKYALTPTAVEELRAKLLLILEEVF